MAWDFSTEPEFEKKLDWIREFVREEIEPLEVLFPGCATKGCWHLFSARNSAGRASARSS